MKTLTEEAFLKWAKSVGLGLDARYPRSAVLTFEQESERRFWCVPPERERRPYFIERFFELMGDWQTCYIWRHCGSWPAPELVQQQGGINDAVELRILQGLSLPLGTAAVLEFQRAELDSMITLLFSTTVFAWSVGEDLYVVPDHARHIIKTDHHGVIHASFHDAADVRSWVSQMAEWDFELPSDPPDPTFKRPPWMSGNCEPPDEKRE
jgi:hypothetical protein